MRIVISNARGCAITGWLVLATALVSLSGYVLGYPYLSRWGAETEIALPTIFCLINLSIAMMIVSKSLRAQAKRLDEWSRWREHIEAKCGPGSCIDKPSSAP